MTRKLKVYYRRQPRMFRNLYNPRIELTGLWLLDAGFDIGDDINVRVYENGKIMIEKV